MRRAGEVTDETMMTSSTNETSCLSIINCSFIPYHCIEPLDVSFSYDLYLGINLKCYALNSV